MTMRMLLDHTRKSAQVVWIETYYVSKWIVNKSELWSFFSVYVGFNIDWGRLLLPGVNIPHNHLTHLCLYELTPLFGLHLNATHMPGGNAASVWQPAECGRHRGQVCHLAVHLSASSPLCLWPECAPTLTGWNCCVCAVLMRCQLWLIRLSLSHCRSLNLFVSACTARVAALLQSIAATSVTHTYCSSQDNMSNLGRAGLGKRYFHTNTAHFRVR